MRQKVAIIFIVCCIGAVLSAVVAPATAQSEQPDWTQPGNMSQSGATNAPVMFKTGEAHIHLLWQDEVAETFVYIQGNGESWGEPITIETPFGTRIYDTTLAENDPTPLFSPWLLAGGDGRIHAFWLDDENALYYSHVNVAEFTSFSAWAPRQVVSESAIAVAPLLDGNGRLHVVYIRAQSATEFPAGVYYRQYVGEEDVLWSAPTRVGESAYFRTLGRADVSLAADASQVGAANYLYVAWDNRPLDKVFFARSTDGGQSWESPVEIDGRAAEDDPGALGPSRIQLSVDGANLMLLWEAGHEGLFCTLVYQRSQDGGNTWQPRQELLAEQQACPQQRQFLGNSGALLFLLVRFEQQSFLLAWDGLQWSKPQAQPLLDGFTDITTNRHINFRWQQGIVVRDGLVVVGQDSEQNKDVWLMGGSAGTPAGWFPASSLWSSPNVILYSQTNINNLEMVTDVDGMVHVIWTQEDAIDNNRSAIYYARWDGGQWTLPLQVLQTMAGMRTEQPDMAVTNDGRVLVVWRSETGALLFSQAAADRAGIPTEWSQIQMLPTLTESVGAPMVTVAGNGRIYVIHALTLNEHRGIYYIHSDDNGLTWSEPQQLFDAVAARWDMLDQAQIAITDDGHMQAIWRKYSLPPEGKSLGMYYALSLDNGRSWSEAAEITAAPIQWSALVNDGGPVVHRLWQETGEIGPVLWHDYSGDSGLTFSVAARVPGLDSLSGPAELAVDSTGQLHLVVAAREMLWYRLWTGMRWDSVEAAPLLDNRAGERLTAAAAFANGILISLFSGEAPDPATGQTVAGLFSVQQSVALPEVTPTPLPTPTPPPLLAATTTAVPEPSPTPFVMSEQESEPPAELSTLDNSVVRLAASALPALVLILVIFGIGIRAVWLGRR